MQIGWIENEIFTTCSGFDLDDERQKRICFNWRNLAPLWGEENIAKSYRYELEDEAEWREYMKLLGYEGELFLEYH